MKDLIIRPSNSEQVNATIVDHFFTSIEARDLFYASNGEYLNLLSNKTLVSVGGLLPNEAIDYYIWSGINAPNSYDLNGWRKIGFVVSQTGEDGKSLVFKWNGDKLGVKVNDPLVTDYQYSESLKGKDGDSIETGFISNGNDLVFGVRDKSNNSLKEVKIDGFVDTVKSTIVLGNYGGIKFHPSDNQTTIILPTTGHMEKGTWWKSASGGWVGQTKVNINSIIIANKTTDNPTIDDFDLYTGAIDEILANGLYILAKGNSSINQVKNFRMAIDDNGSLVLSAYDTITNTFKSVSTLGKLTIVDDLIVKTNGGIFLERTAPDGTKVKARVCGTATSDGALSYGDPAYNTIILGKNPRISTVGVTNENQVLQINPVFKSTKPLAKYSMTFNVGQTRSIKSVQAKINQNIGDYLITCTDLATNKMIYKSRDLFLFNNNLDQQYKLSGDVLFYSTEPFYILEGHQYRIDVEFSNTVDVQGINKIYMGEFSPNNIRWDILTGARAGHYWRISQNGNIDFGNGYIVPVIEGNILICMEDVIGMPNNFDNFSLENVNVPIGGIEPIFVPYMILNTDVLEFDEIVGKKYLDSVLKSNTNGELWVKGDDTKLNSVLITTDVSNQIEFKRLDNVANKTYSNATIKDISLPNFPSLVDTLTRLKTGQVFKDVFDPTTDTLAKFNNANVGDYWQVTKDGTISWGSTTEGLNSIANSNPLITDVVNGNTVTRNVKVVTANGSSSTWIQGGINNATIMSFGIPIGDMNNFNPNNIIVEMEGFTAYADQYIHIDWQTEAVSTSLGYLYVMIEKSKLATQDVAGFKLWLSQHPKKLKYQLIKPYDEPWTGGTGASSISVKTGDKIVCTNQVYGTPLEMDNFVIENPPLQTVMISATELTDGVSGAVPQPLKGTKKYLNSFDGWGDLPEYSSFQGGIIPKQGVISLKKFFNMGGNFEELPVYVGATAIANGISGMVKSALPTERNMAYFGDGTYKEVLSSTSDNTFTGTNVFTKTTTVSTDSNLQLVVQGTSGVPFSGTTLGDTVGLNINNSTVGSRNTTVFCASGSATGLRSNFEWWTNSFGNADRATKKMTLTETGTLLVGVSSTFSDLNSIEAGRTILGLETVRGQQGLQVGVTNIGTIKSNNLTTSRTYQLPDKDGVVALTSDIQSTSSPYALTATTTGKDFVDWVFSANNNAININQVILNYPTNVNARNLIITLLIQKMAGIFPNAGANFVHGILSGNIINSSTNDSSFYTNNPLGVSTLTTTAYCSVAKASGTSVPTSYFKFILFRDSTKIYWINIAPSWDSTANFGFIVETSNGTWSSVGSNGNVPFIRDTTSNFTTGSTVTASNNQLSSTIPALIASPVRFGAYIV